MFFIKNICLTLLLFCTCIIVGVERTIINKTNTTLSVQVNYLSNNFMIPCSFNTIIVEPETKKNIINHTISACELNSLMISTEQGNLVGQILNIPLNVIDKKTDFSLIITNTANTLIGNLTQNGSTKTFNS